MCGIAGWFSTEPHSETEQAVLDQMQSRIAHRGPDGHGKCIVGAARFAHTRLAIIDPSLAKQPLTTRSGNIVITFNGEIYNFRDIRQRLLDKGAEFDTNSDTEVIAVLYETEGLAGFSQLRGMFSFAIWDSRIQKGYLVRDSAGIKPLFYYLAADGALWFSSEAKAVLIANPQVGRLNESALHLVMNFRYVLDDRSMFRDVMQLRPGTILEWGGKNVREIPLPKFEGRDYPSIREAIEDSVKYHLTSDIPVAAYLSGGVDSAMVVAMACNGGLSPLQTYTLDVGDDYLESSNASETASLLGVSNVQGSANPMTVEAMKGLIWHLEVPKINAYQVDSLARLASERHKVVLSGLGADEIFTGYNLHRIIYLLSCLKRLPVPYSWIFKHFESAVGDLGSNLNDPWSESRRGLSMLANLKDLETIYGLIRNVWDEPTLRKHVYGPRMLDAKLEDCHELIRARFPASGSDVSRVLKFERDTKLVNDLLWQEDRCSMAHGIEVRVPFIDAGLDSYIDTFSVNRLMPNGRPKYLLKSVARDLLPRQVLARRKSGFQVQSPEFFHSHLSGLAQIYLAPDRVKQAGLFNPSFIEQTLRLPIKKKYRWHYFMLYLAIGAHVWLELFEDGK